ncbi:helix-turn-helix domain-containing protein [Nocardioides sp. QY071]|uniref:helix-turn-helix domain-containing protein n=1 Tax=Nocardioides sp. QY071 TaxID=3044187 RepID=UPI00249AA772|nr:helix-turn-helix domain-containing protein [Nocardioides sp. QY071]WGY03734.1 helix-turn-helix domain-containing protein [Nocardioides sp. QY071]
MSQLLSVTEAAKVLDCSRGHVYNLIAAGELSAVDIGIAGRPKTRVLTSELEEYIARKTRRAS